MVTMDKIKMDQPKIINGKVWIHVRCGYERLPESDPKYNEILLWIDSQRLLNFWIGSITNEPQR